MTVKKAQINTETKENHFMFGHMSLCSRQCHMHFWRSGGKKIIIEEKENSHNLLIYLTLVNTADNVIFIVDINLEP